MEKKKYTIGIDEVGRGALAGPVVVAAFCLTSAQEKRLIQEGRSRNLALRDSKKLTPRQRAAWVDIFKKISHTGVCWSIAKVTPAVIDRVNISAAANRAATVAAARLIKKMKEIKTGECEVILDGGLYLKSKKQPHPARTVVRADATFAAVMCAAIAAKVYRDDLMVRCAARYPGYGFAIHKGYGTRRHYEALGKQGSCPIHRLTFLS